MHKSSGALQSSWMSYFTLEMYDIFFISIKVLARALSFHTEDCLCDNVTRDNVHHTEDNLNQLTWSLESSCSEQMWRRCCTLRTLPVPVDNVWMSQSLLGSYILLCVCVGGGGACVCECGKCVCICPSMSAHICECVRVLYGSVCVLTHLLIYD